MVVSALQPVGRGFEPRPSHNKDFKNGTHCLLVWRLTLREWSGEAKHAELPMDQPPAVALTAFADVWPRATETKFSYLFAEGLLCIKNLK